MPAQRLRRRLSVLAPVAALALLLTRPGAVSADPGPPMLTAMPAAVVEGDSGDVTMRFIVTLDRAVGTPVTFTAETNDYFAVAPSDYDALPPTVETIPAGARQTAIDITVHGDTQDEGSGQPLLLRLSSPTVADFGYGQSEATVFGDIVDDDETAPPLPAITIGSASVVEGDGPDVTLRFTATLDRPATADISFQAATHPDTATQGVDYDDLLPTTVEFAAGDTAAEIDVTVHGDAAYESPSEGFYLFTDGAVGATVPFLTRGTIIDDDPFAAPLPLVSVSDASLVEGDTGDASMRFVLSLDRPSGDPVTVDASTVPLSGSTADDFDGLSGTTVTFDPGETTAEVDVTVHGDTQLDEGDEAFLLELSDPVGAALGTSAAVGRIIDDDDLDATIPPITISARPATVIEGESATDTALHVAIVLDRPSDVPVTVVVKTSDSDATTEDGDYDAVDQTVSFPAGTMVKDVVVPVHGDDADEGLQEYLVVQLSSPSGASLASPTWLATIIDDDLTPVPSAIVRIDPASVIEGDTGDRTLRFHVTLDRPVDHPVDVHVATAPTDPDTAVAFDALPSTTVHFDIGEVIQAVEVAVHGNTVDDPPLRYVQLQASTATGAELQYSGLTANGYLYDDDPKAIPAPRLSVGSASVLEGDGPDVILHFPLVLDRPSTTPVSVHVATSFGNATAGDDYDPISTTVTFAPDTQVKDIQVTVHGDVFDEDESEVVYLDLSAPTGTTLLSISSFGTIWDDDAPNPGQVRFASPTISTNEADGAVLVEIQRVGGTVGTVTIDYATDDGTAIDGADYDASGGTLSWGPGDASPRFFYVDLLQDDDAEGNETFTVDLTDPTGGAVLGEVTTTTVTIHDDEGDAPPTVDAGSGASGAEGTAITIDGSVSDVEDPDPDITWWAVPDADVDAGGYCSIDDSDTPDPSLTCSDDGTYTLHLSVWDHVNRPVEDTAALTVTNASPSVTVDEPADPASVAAGESLDLSATLADAGTNDSLTCAIDWGDGATEAGDRTDASCTGSHTYDTAGARTITVTASDDDGSTGSDTVSVTVQPLGAPKPKASIGDRTAVEGDSGLKTFTFSVTLDSSIGVADPCRLADGRRHRDDERRRLCVGERHAPVRGRRHLEDRVGQCRRRPEGRAR